MLLNNKYSTELFYFVLFIFQQSNFKDQIGFVQRFMNQEASLEIGRSSTRCNRKGFSRQKVGGKRKLLANDALFQAKLPSYGNRVVHWEDYLTSADQVIPC